MMPENSNPIKEMSWGGVKIDIDNLSSDVDFEVDKPNNINPNFKNFTECVSINANMSKEEFKKMLKLLKPKIPRKKKKKMHGTKRGHRRFELKLRDNRTLKYSDLHFLGFIKATFEIRKMYYDKIGKKLYYFNNDNYVFSSMPMLPLELDTTEPRRIHNFYRPELIYRPELL